MVARGAKRDKAAVAGKATIVLRLQVLVSGLSIRLIDWSGLVMSSWAIE